MAHKTLISGTAYEISGGKTLIGGTAYEIKSGKTLVNGTAYDISFGTTIKITGSGSIQSGFGYKTGCKLVINGSTFTDSTELSLSEGTEIQCIAYGGNDSSYQGKIYLNGSIVSQHNSEATYTYVVKGDATINLYADTWGMSNPAYGTITITEH